MNNTPGESAYAPELEPNSEPEPEPEPESKPVVNIVERMETIRATIPVEPKSGDIVRIRVIYPSGTKLQRNFLSHDSVSLLYQLVELDMFDHGMGIPSFHLCAQASKESIESVCIVSVC